MTIAEWLETVCADADRRALPQLKPLFETLARSTERLRRADDQRRAPAEATRRP
ncbi:MAG TPA: hypothetical protein VM791_08710 [Vicinamibacterales bacterium]|jgi:hypothetical protein|nr:hypothetical protein [Vicinamibacterales bacterium]